MGEIRTQHISPGEVWRTREDLAGAEKKSEVFWKSLSDEKRQGLLLIVDEALQQMRQNLDAWVPVSLEFIADSRLDVYISIHLAEVDDEVVRRKLEAEKMLYEATHGVLAIEADLRERS